MDGQGVGGAQHNMTRLRRAYKNELFQFWDNYNNYFKENHFFRFFTVKILFENYMYKYFGIKFSSSLFFP